MLIITLHQRGRSPPLPLPAHRLGTPEAPRALNADRAVGVLHTLARQRGVLVACAEHKQRRLACARNYLQLDSFTAIELSKRATCPQSRTTRLGTP